MIIIYVKDLGSFLIFGIGYDHIDQLSTVYCLDTIFGYVKYDYFFIIITLLSRLIAGLIISIRVICFKLLIVFIVTSMLMTSLIFYIIIMSV